jgi:lipoprotein-releasing system permease protein
MIVMEKHKDIAILKSMGATNQSVMYLFMAQGVVIGPRWNRIGVVIGWGFCYFAMGINGYGFCRCVCS